MRIFHKKKHNNFATVAAGGVATLRLPVGPTYHKLKLKYKRAGVLATRAQMESDIENVKLVLNGATAWELTGKEILELLSDAQGVEVSDGYLNIPFAFRNARAASGEDGLAWGTADVELFQVQVKLASGAVDPSLEAVSHITQKREALGIIRKFRRTNIPVSSIGEHNFLNYPKKEPIIALHCKSTDIKNVEVTVDGTDVFDQAKEDIKEDLTYAKDFTPLDGYTHVTFGDPRRVSDNLPMSAKDAKGNVKRVQELEMIFDMEAATPFDIIYETYGTL